MKNEKLPLKEMSIEDIYFNEKAIYEVPIYQRNYAWEKEEISALIQDVYDSYHHQQGNYYIGTLVTYHKGDFIYEVIDGQQRLTTLNIVLTALDHKPFNKLTYRARRKSNDTISSMPNFNLDDKDLGIINGFKYAKGALEEIVPTPKRQEFIKYFKKSVKIIHYQVPKDIDLNHYFEIMNSRGEQLEKHEIIKARMMQELKNHDDRDKFNQLWEYCSDMGSYIQQKYRDETIFGEKFSGFEINDFETIPTTKKSTTSAKSISELIQDAVLNEKKYEVETTDSFQPIIDFPNFLLIVLKVVISRHPEKFQKNQMETDLDKDDFSIVRLDDKELIREFQNVKNLNEAFVKLFAFYLLKAKYFLDNYIVHHSHEDDVYGKNPWKLQYWQRETKEGKRSEYLKILDEDPLDNQIMVQILSMFEVSFTARQRKNYLFYCMMYLFEQPLIDLKKYRQFLNDLASHFFRKIYLQKSQLNEINTPRPGSFDKAILRYNDEKQCYELNLTHQEEIDSFPDIYGDGLSQSKGIPLFIFNYLDYLLWKRYTEELMGKNSQEGFFEKWGCKPFEIKILEYFYFSRTRRSLEHYFPTANADGIDPNPNLAQINCFGNYAMIGNEANSAGSNWSPIVKRDHYLDSSEKINQVSVASIKFMIMMQICKDNKNRGYGKEWLYDDMRNQQGKMVGILMNG